MKLLPPCTYSIELVGDTAASIASMLSASGLDITSIIISGPNYEHDVQAMVACQDAALTLLQGSSSTAQLEMEANALHIPGGLTEDEVGEALDEGGIFEVETRKRLISTYVAGTDMHASTFYTPGAPLSDQDVLEARQASIN